jgi:hypothetical protein
MPYSIKWLINEAIKVVAKKLQLMSQKESGKGSFGGKNV